MKHILQSLCLFLSINSFAQLAPNITSPTSFINYFSSATDYISVDGSNTVTAVNATNTIQLDFVNTASDGVKFSPYDLGNTGTQALVDISGHPYVYIKMKGTVGDNIRINLKNSTKYTFIDGYNYRQELACTEYRWYAFDFSAATEDMDEISEIEFVHNTDLTGSGTVYVDSLIIGDAGINIEIPTPVTDFSFRADFTNDFWKDAIGDAEIVVSNDEMKIDVEASDDAYAGAGFKVYLNGSEKYVDISADPIVKLSIKGTDDDTVQVNLKNGSGFDYVDGYNHRVILDGGSSYKEYTFDFSTNTEDMDEIIYIEIIHNQTVQGSGTFYINALSIGDPDAESCLEEGTTTSIESSLAASVSIFPNPTSEVLFIEGLDNINDISLYNLQGQLSLSSVSSSIDVSALPSGMYVVKISTDAGSIDKLVIID